MRGGYLLSSSKTCEGDRMLERLFGQKKFSYKCHESGELHSCSPSFSFKYPIYYFKYPIYYFDVPEDERGHRIQITDDLCQIEPGSDDVDGTIIYCIRVTLDIPIIGLNEPFTWGVWVSQSQERFEKYVETYEEDQSAEQSFGWLAVNMPFYNGTETGEPLIHLKCDVHWGTPGQRPKAHLWECDHRLAVDQRNGIYWEKAAQIANLAIRAFQGRDKSE
jgi:hypothetical protein